MCDFMCAQLLKVKTTPLPWMLTFVVKEKKSPFRVPFSFQSMKVKENTLIK